MSLVAALTVGLLFGSGVLLVLRRDLVRMAAGTLLLSNAAVLGLLATGFTRRGEPSHPSPGEPVTDVVAQALGLTGMVISFGTSALLLALVLRAARAHDSVDLRRLLEAEEASEADAEQQGLDAEEGT